MSSQVVVFKLDAQDYAVPILEVREVIKTPKITPVPNCQDYVLGIINLRGKVVPIINLEKKFNLARSRVTDPQDVLIIDSGNESISGILVDKVDQVLRVDDAEIKPPPKMVECKISDAYLNGVVAVNDRLILIVDLAKILSELGLDQLEKIVHNESNESPHS